MTSSHGLRRWSRLQAGSEVLQTPTDDDRRQRAIRRASYNIITDRARREGKAIGIASDVRLSVCPFVSTVF